MTTKDQPKLAVEMRATTSLLPHPRNARTHSPAQVSQIAASITAFGFSSPILIDAAGMVIAGHGRLAAAQQLGMAEVPTICLSHLTSDEARALMLADNRIAENSGWNRDILANELASLQTFDLSSLGWTKPDLDGLLARLGEPATLDAEQAGDGRDSPDGEEFDEHVAADVPSMTCPACGATVPLPKADA